MSMQGVGRFLGACRTYTALGMASPTVRPMIDKRKRRCGDSVLADSQDSSRVVRLGANGELYELQEDAEELGSFCDVLDKQQKLWEKTFASADLSEVIGNLRKIVIGNKIGLFFQRPGIDTYSAKFIMRKLLIACWKKGGLRFFDWTSVPYHQLEGHGNCVTVCLRTHLWKSLDPSGHC